MVRYTWRSTLLMDVCYTWRLCYIDDLETVLVLHSTGKLELATLEGWISQTPLGWIQENTSWVL